MSPGALPYLVLATVLSLAVAVVFARLLGPRRLDLSRKAPEGDE